MRSRLFVVFSCAMMASVGLTACGGGKAKTDAPPSPYSKGNYPGHLKIGKPYDIDGRTYVPAHDPAYVEEGMASWYGPGFHGRDTANGERFDQHALTAAHRTLPLPSMVRVTNVENGKQAILRVNDRGPFKKDRIIDLSRGSAEKLGVIAKGTAQVRVEYLPEETKQMVAELVRNNQLKADAQTLAALGLENSVPQTEMKIAADAPSAKGFGLISSAAAAEPGVAERAPLGAVDSRSIASPAEVQMARLEREAAPSQPPLSYSEGGAVGRVMPSSGAALPDVAPAPTAAPAVAPVPAPVQAPSELQPFPDSRPDAPLYQPLDAPRMPAPQAKKPLYEREPVAATVASDAAIPSGIFIQAGSFSQAQNAHDLSQRLTNVGRTSVKPVEISGRTWYRVRVGPLADMGTANSALQSLQDMGIRDARVVRD